MRFAPLVRVADPYVTDVTGPVPRGADPVGQVVAPEAADDLDVRRVREQVDDRGARVLVARGAEQTGVAAEGGRIAATRGPRRRARWRRPRRRPPWPRPVRAGSATTTSADDGRHDASGRPDRTDVQAGQVHLRRRRPPGGAARPRRPWRSAPTRPGEQARRRCRGRPSCGRRGRARRPACRTASTSASAPSGRVWKNDVAEMRQTPTGDLLVDPGPVAVAQLVGADDPHIVGHPDRAAVDRRRHDRQPLAVATPARSVTSRTSPRSGPRRSARRAAGGRRGRSRR